MKQSEHGSWEVAIESLGTTAPQYPAGAYVSVQKRCTHAGLLARSPLSQGVHDNTCILLVLGEV